MPMPTARSTAHRSTRSSSSSCGSSRAPSPSTATTRPLRAGDPDDVEALLRRADGLLSEWSELEAVVPSLEHEVTLSSDLSADEVTISADSWRSLVAVSSGRTVGELATSLGLTELGISRAVRDLVELGVVDVSTVSAASAAPATAPIPEAPVVAARSPTTRPAGSAVRPRRRTASPRSPTRRPPAQRAGWLSGDRTGEIPPAGDRPGAAARPQRRQPCHRRAGHAGRSSRRPRPAPPKGASRRASGRNRNGDGAARGAEAQPADGSPPAATAPGRPVARPTARRRPAATTLGRPATPADPERHPPDCSPAATRLDVVAGSGPSRPVVGAGPAGLARGPVRRSTPVASARPRRP